MLQFIDEPIYQHNNSKLLRVGTDCSGIEAPIQALKQLNIPFRHVFASDIDKYCIASIKANYQPEILFGDHNGLYPNGDITQRDISLVPDIDLYVCGFPCQPFSSAGKRKGFGDKRGNVFWSCLELIKVKEPKYFILENVKGLLWQDKENKKDKYGKTWNIIWSELEKLKIYGYFVDWKVLNTRDYGIPQNRERVYIIGSKTLSIKWPIIIKMNNIKDYIDYTDNSKFPLTERNKKIIENNPKDAIFVDLVFGGLPNRKFINTNKYIGCLNKMSLLYCLPLKRYSNCKEILRLQGFPTSFIQVVSSTTLKKQLGNSMSVNVLVYIFENLL